MTSNNRYIPDKVHFILLFTTAIGIVYRYRIIKYNMEFSHYISLSVSKSSKLSIVVVNYRDFAWTR